MTKIFDVNNCFYQSCKIKQGTPEACDKTCPRYNETQFLADASGLPERLKRPPAMYPEAIDKPAFVRLATIKSEIDDFVKEGKNLYIFSYNLGNGKSSWSAKLLMNYFDKIWIGNAYRVRGIFIHVPTLLTRLKNNISDKDEQLSQLLRHLAEVDLVVWDDIGSTSLSSYDHSYILTLVDTRISNLLANIFTGNLDEEDLKKHIGQRLTSRIWGSSEIIEFKGGDRRGYKHTTKVD